MLLYFWEFLPILIFTYLIEGIELNELIIITTQDKLLFIINAILNVIENKQAHLIFKK